MADIWDDDFEDEPQTESELVKQLRAVIRAGKKKNDEYEQELSTLRPTVRKTQLSETLAKLGVTNPKIAGLVPKDVEPTEESLKAWVEDYRDIFNITTDAATNDAPNATNAVGDANGSTDVDSDTAQQWQRIQSQQSQAGASTPDQESAQLAMLQSANKAANGNTDLFLAYLRGEQPIPTS
jgi:uncharacterized protein YdiU (UPF0061 family)